MKFPESILNRELNYGRQVLRSFLNKVQFPSAFPNVLDIGAGVGSDLSTVVAAYPDAKLSAIEFHDDCVKALRLINCDVKKINLERDSFPYPSNSYDLIIANQVFEHCKELFFILDGIAKTLKVGGYFYLGVPNLAALHSRILLAMGEQPSCIKSNSAHIRGFTIPDVKNLLESCFPGGFEIVEVAGSNFYPFPRSVANILSKIFPSLSVSIFFLLRKKRNYDGEFLRYPVGLETNFWLGR